MSRSRESSRLSRLTSGLAVFRAMRRVRASAGRCRCISTSVWGGGAFLRSENSTTAGTTRRFPHAITKIENFRKIDQSVDALIEVLTDELASGPHELPRLPEFTRAALVEAVTTRVMDRLAELHVVEPRLDNVPT